jgi:hypothetical protein
VVEVTAVLPGPVAEALVATGAWEAREEAAANQRG